MNKAIKQYLSHTLSYYGFYFREKRVHINLMFFLICTAILSVLSQVQVVHAGIDQWILQDMMEQDYLTDETYYKYISKEDAPKKSDYRFKLQMPMTLEDYITDESLYNFSAVLEELLEIDFLEPGRMSGKWDEETIREMEEKSTEFIDKSPPKVVFS